MNKMFFAMSAAVLMIALMGYAQPSQAQEVKNLSLDAVSVTASYESTDNPVSLIKDNRYGKNVKYWTSNQEPSHFGEEAYVELQWSQQNVYKEVRAFWASDDETVLLPTEAYVAWWDGEQWQRGATLNSPDENKLSVTEVEMSASRVRVYIRSGKACGLRELQLMGYTDPSVSYKWPEYNPTLNYDFRWEYPTLSAPTKGRLPEKMNVARERHGEWWSVAVGPNANKAITDTSLVLLVKKMDEDFAYFRDVFGWPPDKRARNGYYSQVYGYGSGVGTDSEPNTALGGWQSATTYNGQSWPMVLLSYYPIASFDPNCTYSDRIGQQNACVHEGIHATFADLEGCKQSAWFHEGGNTWLQGEAELAKSGKTPESMGFLSAGNMIAPFMPIECYSGWLLDDTFGGPSAEGVNMFGSSGQICTWRNLLGGVQYGELFPHFLSEIMGRGAIPWIWRYCKGRVLEGMADSIGEQQMRHLILEYRVRQAMIDVGQWSNACRKLIDDNWLVTIQQEWSPYWKKVEPWKATPYANMYKCDEVDSTGWWKPEWRTTPGWSGANQIPLHVNAEVGNIISLHFKPLGSNMVCMLCYRTKQGKIYYSQPVEGEGDVLMQLQDVPANKVVIAVVCNTDYIYKDESTRKKHFDYRLKMGQNIYQPAKAQLKWYNYRSTIRDTEFINGIEEVREADSESTVFTIIPESTVVGRGGQLALRFKASSMWQVPVRLVDMSGRVVYQQSFMHDGFFFVPANIQPGMYILQGQNGSQTSSVKIVVK